MKRYALAMAMCLSISLAFADDVDKHMRAILSDDSFLHGQGYGETYEEADANALIDLMSQISVSLSSKQDLRQEAGYSNGETSYATSLKTELTSYTQATLVNANSYKVPTKTGFHVIRYISRDDLAKTYALRQERIERLVGDAIAKEEAGKIDDALRYYYWAYAMVKSLQYPNESRCSVGAEDVQLMHWLPQRMTDIFQGLEVSVYDQKGLEASLYFTYKGESLPGIHFTFYDGISWTPIHYAKDGFANIELRPTANPQLLKLRYEYRHIAKTNTDPEIHNVVMLFADDDFANAEVAVCPGAKDLQHMAAKGAAKEARKAVRENNELGIDAISDDKQYNKVILSVLRALPAMDYASIRQHFTDNGWDMMQGLLGYGNAKVLSPQEYSFYRLADGRVSCRSITMSFSFANNHKTFTEDIVFTFDGDKKIDAVTFGLGTEAKNDIFARGNSAGWDAMSMLALTDFLENYRTAFALRRLDYIESVFDDNAYIVVGHVIKRAAGGNREGVATRLSDKDVTYTQYSKEQYLKRLRDIFDANEFINIQFANNEVTHMGKGGELYGMQIRQDYYSSHYGDTGYLFLVVDINNPQEPVIKIRTWQPDRNPNIHSELPKWHPDYGLIGPSDFN